MNDGRSFARVLSFTVPDATTVSAPADKYQSTELDYGIAEDSSMQNLGGYSLPMT